MAEQNFENEITEIGALSRNYARQLSKIWLEAFGSSECENNLARLKGHAQAFFQSLVSESLEKQDLIKDEIQKLHDEANKLRSLLKTDVNLPNSENAPLLTIQIETDKSLQDLRNQLRIRQKQIRELLIQQDELCEDLGYSPKPLESETLPNEQDLQEFTRYLNGLKEEREARLHKLTTIRQEIRNYLEILDLKVSEPKERTLLYQREIVLNKETFDGLESLRSRYEDQVKELTAEIDGMRSKLDCLWNRLNTSPSSRRKIQRHKEYNQHTYTFLYQELQRCEELKRRNIKQYVEEIRKEIVYWWDKTLKSESEKNSFAIFTDTFYTDDLLTLHEMQLNNLKSFYEKNQQIFELFADRNTLWERMLALETKATDPARYNNRGGQLLKEEKERKTITSKLPKIEQQITDLVNEYVERENEPFLVYGENILEVMVQQHEDRRKAKAAQSSARKNQNVIAPSTSSANRTQRAKCLTPLLQRNATAFLRKTPSQSIAYNSTKAATTGRVLSTQKRKLNPSEKTTPVAKRTLHYSPTKFPEVRNHNNKLKAEPSATTFKAPIKKTHRVLASTVRRYSGRLGDKSKRRSLNRSVSKGHCTGAPPKILIENVEEDCDTEFTTDSEDFENQNFAEVNRSDYHSFEPKARSSVVEDRSVVSAEFLARKANKKAKTSRRSKANGLRGIISIKTPEQARMDRLPNPSTILCTPECGTVSSNFLSRSPSTPSLASSMIRGRKKLTTKNLPIIL